MSTHRRFKHKVEIPFHVYRAKRLDMWNWTAGQFGRVCYADNPTGTWSAGFTTNKTTGAEVYQFTFKDPRQAILFKLTWF